MLGMIEPEFLERFTGSSGNARISIIDLCQLRSLPAQGAPLRVFVRRERFSTVHAVVYESRASFLGSEGTFEISQKSQRIDLAMSIEFNLNAET